MHREASAAIRRSMRPVSTKRKRKKSKEVKAVRKTKVKIIQMTVAARKLFIRVLRQQTRH